MGYDDDKTPETETFPYTWHTVELPKLKGEHSGELSILQNRTNPDKGNFPDVHTQLLKAIEADKSDIIVASEFSYNKKDGLSVREFRSLLRELIASSRGKDVLIVPGTFVVQKHGKLVSYTCAIQNGNLLHFRQAHNNAPNQIFEVWGKKFGIEACIENGYTRDSHGEKLHDLDVLINVACGLDFGETSHEDKPKMMAVRDGGFGIFVDGFGRTAHKVSRKDGKSITLSQDGPEAFPDSDYDKYR